MAPRLELQTLLETLLESDQVYFQPPPTVAMQYPCIVYKRDNASTEFAGNKPYLYTQRYQVTFISRDPDSDIRMKIAALPMCRYIRYYPANNLHHDVFILYY